MKALISESPSKRAVVPEVFRWAVLLLLIKRKSKKFLRQHKIMNRSIRHLRALLLLPEEKNFGRAAAAMNLSQPAFSRLIQEFENIVDAKFIDRKSRTFKLTPQGEKYLEISEHLVREWNLAFPRLEKNNTESDGRITISVGPAIGGVILPRLIEHMKSESPRTELVMLCGNCTDSLKNVMGNLADVGIGSTTSDDGSLLVRPLLRARLGLLTSDSTFANEASISSEKLKNIDLLRGVRGTTINTLLSSFDSDLHYLINKNPVINDFASMLAIIRSGAFSAITSALAASHPLARDLHFIPFAGSPIERRVFVFKKQTHAKPPQCNEIINTIKNLVRDAEWHRDVIVQF